MASSAESSTTDVSSAPPYVGGEGMEPNFQLSEINISKTAESLEGSEVPEQTGEYGDHRAPTAREDLATLSSMQSANSLGGDQVRLGSGISPVVASGSAENEIIELTPKESGNGEGASQSRILAGGDGNSARMLRAAARYGNKDQVKRLLDLYNVDVNARDKSPPYYTALHLAAKGGHLEVVKLLLEEPNVDVHAKTCWGATALHLAGHGRHVEVVKLLLPPIKKDVNQEESDAIKGRGVGYARLLIAAAMAQDTDWLEFVLCLPNVNVNERGTPERRTALHVAAEGGHVKVVELLLAVPNVDVNANTMMKEVALHLAARNGHVKIVELLLAAPNVDVNAYTMYEGVALHLAARNGHVKIVELLLAAPNVDVNAYTIEGVALHLAARNGHVKIVERLLAAPNVDVNAKTWVEITALHLAAMGGHVKVVELLLAAPNVDVNVNSKWSGTALDLAKKYGHEEVVKHLLDALKVDANASVKDRSIVKTFRDVAKVGDEDEVERLLGTQNVDVNARENSRKRTALHAAAKHGHEEVVRLLLAAPNVDVNAKTRWNYTALHLAVEGGHVKVVELLLAAPNVDVNAYEDWEGTALHLAAKGGHVKVVELLLATPNIDVSGVSHFTRDTLLHAAAKGNEIDVVRMLLKFKDQLRLTEVNTYGKTAIEIAHDKENGDIERALMECDVVKSYVEALYRDRQVYVDAANAILVGAALIASVTFASWLQPPLNYTLGGDSFSTVSYPYGNYPKYVDVEHNIGLGIFWIFNSLSFNFAIGTVVFGACSVLPRSKSFINRNVIKLRQNLLWTCALLALSVLCVLVAFGSAGIIVLVPMLKFRWYMIAPTIIGGVVCLMCLAYLSYNILKESSKTFFKFC